MIRTTTRMLACLCAGLLMLTAACGDDDDDSVADGGVDSGADTDADTDSDADGDTDSDSDSDGECGPDDPDNAGDFADVSDDIDSYTAGSALADQAGAPWYTWNYSAGSAIDPLVSDAQSVSGANSIHVEADDDLVLSLGPLASGAYEIEFQIFVEAGMLGYFNILQRFWTEDESGGEASSYCYWGMDAYFDGDGTGLVWAENETTAFTYTEDAWTPVSATIDLDLNEAAVTIGDTELYTWPWNVGTTGENDCPRLGGVNFYGATQDSSETDGTPSFFVDDVSATQL